MSAIKFFIFVAVAIACVFAAEERVKKDVLVGASPYAYQTAYPTAYHSAGYVAPAAYSAGYVAPAAYSAGYVAPAAYSAYPGYAGYAGYSAYPYAAAYKSALYY